MPPLRNPKREAFAQCLARGLPVAAAYAEAGYTPDSGNAYALKRQPDIRRRLDELTEKKAQAFERAGRDVLGRLAQTKEGRSPRSWPKRLWQCRGLYDDRAGWLAAFRFLALHL